jgi:hypothetical protein
MDAPTPITASRSDASQPGGGSEEPGTLRGERVALEPERAALLRLVDVARELARGVDGYDQYTGPVEDALDAYEQAKAERQVAQTNFWAPVLGHGERVDALIGRVVSAAMAERRKT